MTARFLPPLSALRAFEATARLGSLSRAALELGRTHGAISRRLRLLQDGAGVALFEKSGTGVRLTREGAAFQAVVAEALDGLERGYRRLVDEAAGPSLHVACSATFAMRWLVPHLAGFYRRHPQVHVRLSMTSAREYRHDGADLILTWDPQAYGPWDSDRMTRLAPVAFGPVCAPEYPTSPDGDGGLVCPTRIAHEHTSSAWDIWQAVSGRSVRGAAELRFPHAHLCLEAATSGLGVALIDQRLIRDELAEGRLVAPCGFAPFPDGFVVLAASERASSPSARAFVAWLGEALESGD